MSWVLAFAGFAALIILHEAGHFLAAKAVGMRVERFYLFFPPKLVSVRRGETEYGIGAIPLGGYVKISGMNPDEELPDEVRSRAYHAQPVWKRVVVIAAGPAVNLLVAFVMLFVLAFSADEATGVGVGDVVTDSPAAAQLREGDRILAIGGVGAGSGAPADQATRLSEALDGLRCEQARVAGCKATRTLTVVVDRDGERQRLTLRPYYDAEIERFRLGFSFELAAFVPIEPSAPEAVELAADRMWYVTSRTVSVIVQLFDAEQREQLSGVVGGYEVTRQSIEFDAHQALTVLALISLSLAVINLFPFLPFDGGHIFWAIVEKLRGKPVPFSVMERAGVLGFALMLLLFFIGLSNDIGRLTGEGFDVR